MNYKLQIGLLALFLSFIIYNLAFIIPVSAHVLKTDGSIGAVLHIDPNDDPVANSPAYFFFEFKDKQNKFQPGICDCTFAIKEAGQQIYSQPLFENDSSPSLTNSSVTYTFPKKDVYQVIVTGNPNSPGQFQPFDLTYDIRVDKDAEGQAAPTQPNWLSSHLYLLIGLAIILVVCSLAFVKKPKKE